jgi:hypothetical protein
VPSQKTAAIALEEIGEPSPKLMENGGFKYQKFWDFWISALF